MAVIHARRLLPPTEGATIDVDAIERELADLWRAPGRLDARGVEVALSRTSVLTLFVYAAEPSRAHQAKEVIGQLSGEHPSRIVLLTGLDPSSEAQWPGGEVSIQCKLDVAERYAPCYEQISLSVPESVLDLLPSLLIPLSLPDLPTFLWWSGTPPIDDHRFGRIARAVDRLVLDSLDFARPLRDLMLVRGLYDRLRSLDTTLSDLNWARIAPWQEMTARIFDVPHSRRARDSLTEVWVVVGRYDSFGPNPAQALLYLGWLGSRLGWTLDDAHSRPDGCCLCLKDASGKRIEWNLCFEPYAARLHGHLLSVLFRARQAADQATFTISRGGLGRGTVKLRAQLDQEVLVEHAFHHALFDLQRLLLSELETLAPDPLYETALRDAARLAEAARQWIE